MDRLTINELQSQKEILEPVDTVVREVISLWGNGNDRKQYLERAGYNYR